MKIRQKTGRVIYAPLSTIFQVTEVGGSSRQIYDTTSFSYIPNRAATPLNLKPSLIISDPDGIVNTADYVAQMSAIWELKVINGSTETILEPDASENDKTNYWVDSSNHTLKLYRNVQPSEVIHVTFYGRYLDSRRQEVLEFFWEKDLTCEAQTDLNVRLDTGRWSGHILLVPMKNWRQFGIPVQLRNGDSPIADADASYQWEWWDEDNSQWEDDFTECPWFVSGDTAKEIIVDADYIQDIVLRVRARAYNNNHTLQHWAIRLRRWYGQFDYDVEFVRGKYVFHDSDTVELNAWVATAKGIIQNPCKYFDMELFFATGNDEYHSVGYGEEVTFTRNDLQLGEPKAGILCREKSAYLPLCDDNGKLLCDDEETPIFIQIPTKSREV